MNKEILFEYMRYIVISNEINNKLWNIIDEKNSTCKEKINALELLNQSNNERVEVLMNAPESYVSVKKNISEAKDLDKVENNPILKFTKELSIVNNTAFQTFKSNISTKRS